MAHKNYNMDPVKNKFHKILVGRGFHYDKTVEEANRFAPQRRDADNIKHYYIHETKVRDKVQVWIDKAGEQMWFLKYEQNNGIIAPSYGTTKPGLVRTLEFNYGKKA